MNFKHIPSFNECKNIVNNNTGFIMKREIIDSIPVITFAYRLALVEDFINIKGARNLRGITFREDTKELIALPFHKFWNLNENEHTQIDKIENKNVLQVTEKYDGSLVYFFMINNKLHCKTKLNSFSEQALQAMNIVNNDLNLKNNIKKLIRNNYTPMFEFISPKNQIVILYGEEKLKYICSRNMKDGTYNLDYFEGCDPVDIFPMKDVQSTVNVAKNYYGHEGFVITFEDHDMIKIKTEEYFKLHKIRSNVLNENILVDLILNENLDDIKNTLFSSESNILEYVSEFEKKIVNKYNNFIQDAELFYHLNKELNRKEYAIKAQKEIDHTSFSLAMELYSKDNIDEDKFKKRFINKKLWN